MPEHPTTETEYSLLRSPKASEGSGGALGEQEALKRGNTVGVRDQVLDLVAEQGMAVSRAERNLPTPAARDWKDGQAEHKRNGVIQTDTVARAVINSGEVSLLGTPRTSSANSPSSKEMNNGAAKARLEDQAVGSVKGNISWGRFEPAVRRWEEITGMPAPEPTKPDGKDGAHRLSSEFTEWMMGLPSGWVTGVGLSRKDELTACGNGVVPQQAYLALEMILGKKVNEKGERIPMLPTPTPSDSYIGNLKSEQTKEGSMHSVNLPKAINLIREEKL